jgi:hypothetical protein
MRAFIVALFAGLLVSGAAQAQLFTHEYHGRDAGWLVLSVSSNKDANADPITLFYDQTGDGSDHGSLQFSRPDWTDLSFGSADFHTGDEVGDVIVRSLHPGTYQLDSFLTRMGGQNFGDTFHIPFTILAGQTTYLGNFRFVSAHEKGFVGYLRARDFYFVVRNFARRDIGIADHKDHPPRGRVSVALPDLMAVNSPLFPLPDEQAYRH